MYPFRRRLSFGCGIHDLSAAIDGITARKILRIDALTMRIHLDFAAAVKQFAFDLREQGFLFFLSRCQNHHVTRHHKFGTCNFLDLAIYDFRPNEFDAFRLFISNNFNGLGRK